MTLVSGSWQYDLKTSVLPDPAGTYTVTVTVPETGQTVTGHACDCVPEDDGSTGAGRLARPRRRVTTGGPGGSRPLGAAHCPRRPSAQAAGVSGKGDVGVRHVDAAGRGVAEHRRERRPSALVGAGSCWCSPAPPRCGCAGPRSRPSRPSPVLLPRSTSRPPSARSTRAAADPGRPASGSSTTTSTSPPHAARRRSASDATSCSGNDRGSTNCIRAPQAAARSSR